MAEGRRRLLLVGVTLAVAVPVFLAAAATGDLPPPVLVSIGDRTAFVQPGTTFGTVIGMLHLRARPGRLLDVRGRVLQRWGSPGRILFNGDSAPRSTVLAQGSTIEVLDGKDRTEGTRRVRTRLRGRRPGDPQFTLGTSRVVEIATEGRISGEMLSVAYRSLGRTKRPPAVALTFDDGPWPHSTRRILGILKRMHAKATFFVIGELARRYPRIVRQEIRAGMVVGNHSFSHPNSPPFNRLEPHRILTEIAWTNRILRKRFRIRPRLFRPPGGSYDGRVVATAHRLGLRLVLWDVDPRDWSSRATPGSIVRNVLTHVRPGSIVDLHDGGGDQSATIAALPSIIRGIRRIGLRLATMGR